MEKFELEITLDNEAMKSSEDIARALEKVARRLRNDDSFGIIRDDNGNTVGHFGKE